ncbi:acyl dehydratase [Pusillimonas sp. TS35]|uniref:MaoC family dehydratase n=1 Tax=Paracandidimonas lactea TaxID=2895524 RepID=UPI00136F1B68|nr:MaoC family dehydratase [Paracandidimonas lactea]MYN13206.1 acyl dehydratase [Pusillimonas sp. TS35]
MKYQDFKVGMVIKHGPVTVAEEEMISFAKSYDPQWFHVDAPRAQESRWGGLIASGWFTCGLAMRMAVESVLEGSESFGSPGLEKLRWLKPVRAGDALRLESRVDSLRRSESRTELGIMRWSWLVYNQHDEQVLDVQVTSMFDLGGEQPA